MEGLIAALIQLCVIVLLVYVVLWVLSMIGIALPQQVVTIVWVIVALVALLIIFRNVLPQMGVKIMAIGSGLL